MEHVQHPNKSSLADNIRLLSVSAPHSSSWLSMIPTPGQCLHLDPEECHIVIKWWFGMNTSAGSQCSLCYDHSLDPLGHHATTCKRGGDVIRHNNIRDVLAESFRQADISVKCEAGSGLSHDNRRTRPADILVSNWFCSSPAALDLTVISPLKTQMLLLKRDSQGGQQLDLLKSENTLKMIQSVKNLDGSVCP